MEDLVQKLRHYSKSGTPAERRIARYFSEHMNELPFETAASVADRLNLSPMTVGRFLRTLGYQGLDGMKVQIRETSPPLWSPSASNENLRKNAAEGNWLAGVITEQIDALHQLYNLTSQPQWPDAANTILSSSEVFVAAHPRHAGIARHLCERLALARDRVYRLDGMNGSYAELLAHQGSEDALLIVVDCNRFLKSRLLARAARRSGCKVLLVTGRYTTWGQEYAHITLALPPLRSEAADSMVALTALLHCLAETVIAAAGTEAEIRGRRIGELETLFAEMPPR